MAVPRAYERGVLRVLKYEKSFGHDYFLALLDCGHERGITLLPSLAQPERLHCFVCEHPCGNGSA